MFKIFVWWNSLLKMYRANFAQGDNSFHVASVRGYCRFRLAKLRLASNPGTAPEVLNRLSMRGAPDLLERIAENRATDVTTLTRLACHESSNVRGAVADNVNAPLDIVRILGSDQSVDVRYVVAENHHLPPELLETLVEDDNPYVAARARRTLKNLQDQ